MAGPNVINGGGRHEIDRLCPFLKVQLELKQRSNVSRETGPATSISRRTLPVSRRHAPTAQLALPTCERMIATAAGVMPSIFCAPPSCSAGRVAQLLLDLIRQSRHRSEIKAIGYEPSAPRDGCVRIGFLPLKIHSVSTFRLQALGCILASSSAKSGQHRQKRLTLKSSAPATRSPNVLRHRG